MATISEPHLGGTPHPLELVFVLVLVLANEPSPPTLAALALLAPP